MNCDKGPSLWTRAKEIIPGGSQLLSKRSEQFLPELWPSYFSRANGVDIWDLDNNHFVDMAFMGVGCCPLGYCDPDVDEAVIDAVKKGSMCTLNCPEEVWLAEKLIKLNKGFGMARFTRCGGEAMAVAVRISRAFTRKDTIAFCGYHGWHDWYLAANLADNKNLDGHLLPGLNPLGVPRALIGSAVPFNFNQSDELLSIVERQGENLAAIVMEPIRDKEPSGEFLSAIHQSVEETGAVLIIDEVSSGFRLNVGGAYTRFGYKPDIAVFAKALGNGYPIGAIVGREEVMEIAQDTFISSTNWTERIGPVAALATIEKYQREDVPRHLVKIGKDMQEMWIRISHEAEIPMDVGGIPPLSHFLIPGEEGQHIQTIITKLMLEHEQLAGKSFYPSFVHQQSHLDSYESALEQVMEKIRRALDKRDLNSLYSGNIAHSGFKRLT